MIKNSIIKSINIVFMLILVLAFGCGTIFCLSACKTNTSSKISVVCTIFPEYDWVKQIIGDEKDKFELTLLMNNGTDLHNYQPTVADIAKISMADIFIYVGGESDEWVDNALQNATNKDMIVINLLEILGDNAKEEEMKEGMQEEEDEHEHEHEHDEEEHEYDEHVWLSLKNTKIFMTELASRIADVDIYNKETYISNTNNYIAKLDTLDNEYQETVNSGSKTTLLFGDRFPFRYLMEDYNLDYYAAFIGCSAETEASFETIAFLAGKVDELGLNTILKIETSNGSIANTIRENTTNKNQSILTLDSMQNTTLRSGKTYLSIMESNLEILKEAVK